MASQRKRKRTGPKRITLQDVADAAGVSLGAASASLRGVQGPIKVSKETRERVQRIAREMKYRPHAAAQAMAGQAFKALGVLSAAYVYGSYFNHVLRAVALQAEKLGYHIVLTMERSRAELPNAPVFATQLIDGLIIPAESDEPLREAVVQCGIPHIWLNAGVDEPFNCVVPDEYQGMQLAVDHLVELGHRRIAYIPDNDPEGDGYHQVETRRIAFRSALAQHGLEPVGKHDTIQRVDEYLEQYLHLPARPTAIVVYSDAIAALTTRALFDRGMRVPDDMSVVGYEGVVWQNFAHPSLTTVRAPVTDLGINAVQRLVESIQTGEPVPSVKLPHTLEVHESTGPAPADA